MIFEVLEVNINNNCVGAPGEDCPKLFAYVPSNSTKIESNRKRKTIVICPGGGYSFTSDREAEAVALKLVGEGFNAFILNYSTVPATFPTALCELATSISIIRQNEHKWNIDVNQIIVMGFSAGGHLAASLGSLWHTDFLEEQTNLKRADYKPNGLVLSYPVITIGEHAHKDSFINLANQDSTYYDFLSIEKNVTHHMPPTFMWHTDDDDVVPVENSLLLATAMKRHKISLELHIFPHGVHGLSLASELVAKPDEPHLINPDCQVWFQLCTRWLHNLGKNA